MRCLFDSIEHSAGVLEFRQRCTDPFLNRRIKTCLLVGATTLLLQISLYRQTVCLVHLGWAVNCLGLICVLLRYITPKEESLLAIAGLGIQLQTTLYSGTKNTYFVDVAKIKDIVVNEGITTNNIIFYLAVVVEDADHLVLPFETYPPRLKNLLFVYRRVYAVVFGNEDPDSQEGQTPSAGCSVCRRR